MLKASTIIFIAFLLFGCNSTTEQHREGAINPEKGKTLFTNLGCVTCHSISGEKRYGPTLNNILNTQVEVIQDGKTFSVPVDREYLKKSIMDPEYQKVRGYERSKMAKPTISSEEVDYLVDYLISINPPGK